MVSRTAHVEDVPARLARQVGIARRVTLHTMRHTFCTLALEAGVDVVTVQRQAGHANIETTTRYLHPTVARDRARMSGFRPVLPGPTAVRKLGAV